MNARELAEATKQFDKPIRFEDTRPLTAAERTKWERAKKGSIYSLRIYDGKTKTVKIRLDGSLLKEFDNFAKRNHMSRDEFITRCLRSAIAFVD